MGEDRVARRALLGVGVGALASLAGCSGLFIEETATPTREPGTETPTATAQPTTRRTESPRATTERAVPAPSDDFEVRDLALAVELSQLEKFTTVIYRFDVENTGSRRISDIEFRLRVRYEYEDYSRIVATDYPRFWFDSGEDDDDDDERDGLPVDETQRVRGEVRFERDGRAQESTDADRFSLELTVRRIRFL